MLPKKKNQIGFWAPGLQQMPGLANQILGISSGVDCIFLEVSVVNSMGSHWINSAYLCLGSLYVHDFPSAMNFCKMEIVLHVNTVLQLQDNWYLVPSPHAFTSCIICLNNSNSAVFVKARVNCIFLSPSCHRHLKEHVQISNFSICLEV